MNSIGGSAGSALAGVVIDRTGSYGGSLTVTALALGSLAIAFMGFRQIRQGTENPVLTDVSV